MPSARRPPASKRIYGIATRLAEPGTTETGAIKPGTTEPDAIEPDATEPDAAELKRGQAERDGAMRN